MPKPPDVTGVTGAEDVAPINHVDAAARHGTASSRHGHDPPLHRHPFAFDTDGDPTHRPLLTITVCTMAADVISPPERPNVHTFRCLEAWHTHAHVHDHTYHLAKPRRTGHIGPLYAHRARSPWPEHDHGRAVLSDASQ